MAPLPGRIFHRIGKWRPALLLLAALALVLVATTSDAHPPWRTSTYEYSVTLEDEAGNPLGVYQQAGTTWVLGYLGDRYNVRLRNHTDRRVEAVLSIDGRDSISGQQGDFVRQRGYVVPPYGSVLVDGFRRNLEQTAAFRFSSPSGSYSSRMGTPQNVGVIGVAFFPEREPPRQVSRPVRPVPVRPARPVRPPVPVRPSWPSPRDELYDYDAATGGGRSASPKKSAEAPAPAASPRAGESTPSAEARRAPSPSAKGRAGSGYGDDSSRDKDRYSGSAAGTSPSRLGTEYGEDRYSPVNEVSFVRKQTSEPAVLLTVRYDDERGLLARGIDVYPRRYWNESRADAPEAFPANRFAPPPPY
jgi:hypothetical protein